MFLIFDVPWFSGSYRSFNIGLINLRSSLTDQDFFNLIIMSFVDFTTGAIKIFYLLSIHASQPSYGFSKNWIVLENYHIVFLWTMLWYVVWSLGISDIGHRITWKMRLIYEILFSINYLFIYHSTILYSRLSNRARIISMIKSLTHIIIRENYPNGSCGFTVITNMMHQGLCIHIFVNPLMEYANMSAWSRCLKNRHVSLFR